MKRCTRYLDYLNHPEELNSTCAEWHDLLSHANNCSDCSTDIKMRSAIAESCTKMPEPKIPLELHAHIMNGIEISGNTPENQTTMLQKILDYSLKPIELSLTIATVILVISLIGIEHQNVSSVHSKTLMKQSYETSNVPLEINQLDQVTPQEIDEFLAKLKEFQQMYPTNTPPSAAFDNFQLQLVTD